MISLEYTQELTKTGLTQDQAVVYEILLKVGEQQASSLYKQIPSTYSLSRPLVYKILDELIEKELVEKNDPKNKVSTFIAKHPIAIGKYFDVQKAKIDTAKKQFEAISGQLSSIYNLSSGKPGVQFFEGEQGIWEVLLDSTNTTEEVLTYADIGAIQRYIPELNAEYSAIREDKHIKTRGLIVDSPEARTFLKTYDKQTTTTKLIPNTLDIAPFQTIMKIYDQKVSYITLTDSYFIGVIITDQFIANTHKYLFESLWELSSGEVV